MFFEDVTLKFIMVVLLSLALFWRMGVSIKRYEGVVIRFYWALREKYPHSYVKQAMPVRFVRKRFQMDSKERIHWVISFCHYLQLVMLAAPIITLFLCLIIPTGCSFASCLKAAVFPCALFSITLRVFLFIQCIRCDKIKKKNPKYAKAELQEWGGGH